MAIDAPFTYGRRGARWYEIHHALARLASRELGTVVHAYVYDADEMEQVISWGNGARSAASGCTSKTSRLPTTGARRRSRSRQLKDRWPLGHLARVYGVTRSELVRMPRSAHGALLDLRKPDLEEIARLRMLLPAQRYASGM